ncbi:MAG: hypothetical protein JAY74_25490 [Candidatus Thiodiazotropha taylori]|nr:hypothetical protein [Candidatus Thiodiazotropha taylori]
MEARETDNKNGKQPATSIFKYFVICVAYIGLNFAAVGRSDPAVYILAGTAILSGVAGLVSRTGFVVLPVFLMAINVMIVGIGFLDLGIDYHTALGRLFNDFEGYLLFFGPSFVAFIIIYAIRLVRTR